MTANKKDVTTFTNDILRWFDRHGRHDLPWQKNTTPYRVWVSEIMLQQTQVSTVTPYYQRFMKSFPSVKALALAKQDDVLAHWSGLGYYARARNLHRAAQIVHQKHHGRFPNTVDALSELPGIGRSTAGAILSLAMEIPATILDGNVKRVLARYHAIEGWPGKTDVLKKLWEIAEQYTPLKRCNDYTQAMMDLGAIICTRTQPKCLLCPLVKRCKAHAMSCEEDFPGKKPKSDYPTKATRFILLLDSANQLLLEKRPPVGIWGGLWSFPECPVDTPLEKWCDQYIQCEILRQENLPILYHKFSHFQLKIQPILLNIQPKAHLVMESNERVWYHKNDSLPGGIAAPVSKLLSHFNFLSE